MKMNKKNIRVKVELCLIFFSAIIIIYIINLLFNIIKSSLFSKLIITDNFNEISSVISLFAISTTFIVLAFTMVDIVFKKLKANIWFLDETRSISLVEACLFWIKIYILNVSLYNFYALYYLIMGNNYSSVGYSITAIFCSLFIIILLFINFFRTNVFKDCERVNLVHLGFIYKVKINTVCKFRVSKLYKKYKKISMHERYPL